jgi:hypothetical protein
MGTAQLFTGDRHYTIFGQTELQPNTTYWAIFDIFASVSYLSVDASLKLGEPGVGTGNWFNTNDAKSAWLFEPENVLNYWGGYYDPIQMVISTVPEPTALSLILLGVAAAVVRRSTSKRVSVQKSAGFILA